MSTAATAGRTPTSDRGASTATSRQFGPRAVIGALWLFAILNYLYCDVLATHDPNYLREILTGQVGGLEMSEGFLLGAAVLMTIPMASVLIARIAPHRLARVESIVAGLTMTVVQLATLFVGSRPTGYYLYFTVIEVLTTATIVWVAATRWRVDG